MQRCCDNHQPTTDIRVGGISLAPLPTRNNPRISASASARIMKRAIAISNHVPFAGPRELRSAHKTGLPSRTAYITGNAVIIKPLEQNVHFLFLAIMLLGLCSKMNLQNKFAHP